VSFLSQAGPTVTIRQKKRPMALTPSKHSPYIENVNTPSMVPRSSMREEPYSPVYERDIMSPATVAARVRHRSLKKTMKLMDKNRKQRNVEAYNKMLK